MTCNPNIKETSVVAEGNFIMLPYHCYCDLESLFLRKTKLTVVLYELLHIYKLTDLKPDKIKFLKKFLRQYTYEISPL